MSAEVESWLLQPKQDHLKLCSLWYDEVIFETIGEYDQARLFRRVVGNEDDAEKTIKELTDIIVPLHSKVDRKAIAEDPELLQRGYPRWGERSENYTYPDPEDAQQFAHNRLLKAIEAEKGVVRFENGNEIQLAEGRARIAVDAVLLWERVNSEIECMLQARKDEELAMIAMTEFSSQRKESASPFELFHLTIPSLADVSWQEIVRLRHHGGLSSLRSKIAEAIEKVGSDLMVAKKILDDLEKNSLEEIIEMGRPKLKKIAIESLIANIPGLAVNPYGVYVGFRDTIQARRKAKDLGWLYLLRDVRKTAAAADENVPQR